MDSKFPSNYNKLLFDSVCIKDERNVLSSIITNINDNTNDKSKIYQKLPQSFIVENNCTVKKVHCKNMFSINKIVDMLNNKNEIDTSLSNTKKEIDKNKIVLSIPKSNNKSVNEEIKQDNKEKKYGNNKEEIDNNNISNEKYKLSFNNINKPSDYNTDDKTPLYNILKNENDKRKNLEENVKRKRYKKAKTESLSNDIDIEFPIIRNLNSKDNENNNVPPKLKHLQKQKLMKQIEVFNNKLLNNKEMDKFLEKTKQIEEDTNDLSILDKVILKDISKKITIKTTNDNSDTELIDANGTTNTNDNSNNNNRNFNNYSSNSSNSNINFNGNFSQFNRNISRNFNNFNDNNENRKNSEDNNIKRESNNDPKTKITDKEIRRIRRDLRRASVDCSERGLFQAAKWASEQLNSITKVTESLNKYRVYKKKNKIKKSKDKNQAMDDDKNEQEAMDEDKDSSDEECDIYDYSDSEDECTTNEKQKQPNKNCKYPYNPKMTYKEYDKFLYARSLFDIREFDRASYILNSLTHPKCVFLKLYSKFMAGEKRKEEEVIDIIGLNDNNYYINKEVLEIENDLIESIKNNQNDGFLFYLYGVLCAKKNQKKKAIQLLVRSVKLYPYNWSAWLELASCLITQELITSVLPEIENNIMSRFFMAHLALEYQNNNENFENYIKPCMEIFDDSNYIRSQLALSNYHTRDFEESEQYFDKIIKKDPYTLENMDTFSHVLYVTEKTTKLSYLAHNCCMIDKYRQETCCIIGNYYSLRGEHEKAVLYFQRALKLNKNYLSAWTLMGHEYIELKNTQAAIEAYRRAIDLSQRDYRAWYGLGQIYEVLRMPYYSLYYYQQAASLRPYDSRMWVALAQCYDYIDHTIEAIKCYKRALIGGDSEPIVLIKLANLYAKLGNNDTAAYYYRLSLLEYKKLNNIEDTNYQEGCLFMANYYKRKKNYTNAEKYLQDVLHTEEGKSLVKELKSLQMAEA